MLGVKLRFYSQQQQRQIKVGQERMPIDFKSDWALITRNCYMLVIVDKFSHFSVLLPCPNLTYINAKSLDDLFSFSVLRNVCIQMMEYLSPESSMRNF